MEGIDANDPLVKEVELAQALCRLDREFESAANDLYVIWLFSGSKRDSPAPSSNLNVDQSN